MLQPTPQLFFARETRDSYSFLMSPLLFLLVVGPYKHTGSQIQRRTSLQLWPCYTFSSLVKLAEYNISTLVLSYFML